MQQRCGAARRTGRARAAVVAALLAAPAAIIPGCGARTGLRVGDAGASAPPPSSGFCASASYRSGYSSLSIYILLDMSGSMNDDNKWDEATAALSAFVSDPAMSGLGVGLAYFPIGATCDTQTYALPAVPIAPLPGNADKIKNSLAAHAPKDGDTPTRPALRAAIEYARGRQIANPHEEVAIALVTDGVPNVCSSTVDNVAEVAREGVNTPPQVLTFVIGQEAASESGLARIAAAGGTGKAIIVGKSPNSAQKLVNALEGLRQTLGTCQFAVPDAGSATLLPSDVTASYLASSSGAATPLSRVADASACNGTNSFYVDDPEAPSRIQLCPGICNAVQQNPESRVEVTAGCGGHSPQSDGGTTDGGTCDSIVTFSCTPKCGSGELSPAICQGTFWTCPPGTVQTDTCGSCPTVPHGCCKSDGTVGVASCVNGAWVCPPGGKLFGEPGCRPPDVCTELLPCAAGQYCKVPDFSCGTGNLPGKCQANPASCPGGGTAACGCGGTTYASQCAAAADGTDLSIAGNCAAPSGTFACGPYFCNVQSQICEHSIDLTKTHAQNGYACITSGPGCNAQCTCPQGKTCKGNCVTSGGARTLTCTIL